MMRTLVVALMVVFVARPTLAGVVQTTSARLEGKVAVDKGQVTVDGKKIDWADVLFYVPDSFVRPATRSESIHLRNGEIWSAELIRVANNKLDFRSDLLGLQRLDLSKVAALDFGARPTMNKTGAVYRTKGEPVYGTLISLKSGSAVIDSVVGELELPRNVLTGYRLVDDPARRGDDDWIYLTDGSVLRGQVTPHEQGFQLKHAVAGTVVLPAPLVSAVVRRSGRLLDLTESQPVSFKASSILPPGVNASPRHLDGTELFAKGLEFEPRTATKYKLEGTKAGRLRALLLPSASAAGDTRVTIKVGGKVLLERDVTPANRPEPIVLDVRGGDEVELLIDFGSRLRFPCGVVLGDPHVTWN